MGSFRELCEQLKDSRCPSNGTKLAGLLTRPCNPGFTHLCFPGRLAISCGRVRTSLGKKHHIALP